MAASDHQQIQVLQGQGSQAVTKRLDIKLNVANALRWLGSLYRNPADAIKEHVSNAIDEHLKAQASGSPCQICHVLLTIEKDRAVIEYPYGMDWKEFETALQRVADSAKKTLAVPQIGQLGIGIFSFQQIGKKCTFLSRKSTHHATIRVVLREGVEEAEFSRASKREALEAPGMKIVISELKFDPTKPRGPLAPERLSSFLSEKFDGYLKKGWLRIDIRSSGTLYQVRPMRIELPRLGAGLASLSLPGHPEKTIALDLYFDPSGKGIVAIRHMGVVVVEDLKQLSAYGIEDSVYSNGDVRGFIDADFLTPLPARTGFNEDRDWIQFLELLDRHRPQIEAEIEELRQAERERALSEIQRRAVQLAREILDLEGFRDLEWPGGLAKARERAATERTALGGRMSGERSREPGDRPNPSSLRINYEERPFEDGPNRHSRFVGGVIQCNTLNPDYQEEMRGSEDAKLAYAALVIGKEIISYNDRSKTSDDYLEKMLGYHFKLKQRIRSSGTFLGRRRPERSRKQE